MNNSKFIRPATKFSFKNTKPTEELTFIPIEPTSSPLKIKHYKNDMFLNYDDINYNNTYNKDKEQSIQKIQKMSAEEVERYK
jgi:hypothetical protein